MKHAERLPEDRADANFRARYRDLEDRFKARTEEDRDVYLPNPEPTGPVDYVFVCMEPSLGGGSPTKVRADVAAGGRNFVNSIEDFILHFSIRQYLCEPAQRYHITDLSKGAMPVKDAGVERNRRYDRWYPLLEEELKLVATPGAEVFALGRKIEAYLKHRMWPVTYLLHYSGQAAPARAAGIAGNENSFARFKGSIALEDVLATAEDVLNACVPASIRNKTLARLAHSQLTESRKKLIFNYKLAFERRSQ